MIRRTLLVVDGSGAATTAHPHAAAPARSFEGDVILLPVGGPAAVEEVETLAGSLRADGLRCGVLPSSPATSDAVVAAANESAAELIVMPCGDGTKAGLRRVRLRHEVVARAATSVLIAMPAAPGTYRRIVVPVDGSRLAEWALCLAISIARTDDAELVLVHAIATGDAGARTTGEAYLAELRAMLTPGDPRVRTRIVEGSVPAALTRAFREERPDLIAITAHGAVPGNGRRYGRIAGELIARAPASVLVFQDAPKPTTVRSAVSA